MHKVAQQLRRERAWVLAVFIFTAPAPIWAGRVALAQQGDGARILGNPPCTHPCDAYDSALAETLLDDDSISTEWLLTRSSGHQDRDPLGLGVPSLRRMSDLKTPCARPVLPVAPKIGPPSTRA